MLLMAGQHTFSPAEKSVRKAVMNTESKPGNWGEVESWLGW